MRSRIGCQSSTAARTCSSTPVIARLELVEAVRPAVDLDVHVGLVADDGMHQHVDAELAAAELHAHRVHEERHVVGDDVDRRVRRLPAVLLERRVVDADARLAGLAVLAERPVRERGAVEVDRLAALQVRRGSAPVVLPDERFGFGDLLRGHPLANPFTDRFDERRLDVLRWTGHARGRYAFPPSSATWRRSVRKRSATARRIASSRERDLDRVQLARLREPLELGRGAGDGDRADVRRAALELMRARPQRLAVAGLRRARAARPRAGRCPTRNRSQISATTSSPPMSLRERGEEAAIHDGRAGRLEPRLEHVVERLGPQRLAQVVVHAGRRGSARGALHRVRGHGDDRRVARSPSRSRISAVAA